MRSPNTASLAGTPVAPAGNTLAIERSVQLRTGKIEVSPARMPLEFRTIDTSGRGQLELDGGDVLRWKDGLVSYQRRGRFGAALVFDGETATLITNVVNACCAVKDLPPGTMIRFESEGRIEADGMRLERDGRLVLE